MTDDIHQPDDADRKQREEDRSDDHQHAREACQHAIDALSNGNPPRARSLLDEAQTAVERAQHDESDQLKREAAWDCYD